MTDFIGFLIHTNDGNAILVILTVLAVLLAAELVRWFTGRLG